MNPAWKTPLKQSDPQYAILGLLKQNKTGITQYLGCIKSFKKSQKVRLLGYSFPSRDC